ncbi:hypothetical protein ABPG72_020000 [Tetrahymena utriculariae]
MQNQVYWCPKISEIKPGGAKSIKKYTKIKVFEVLTKVLEDNQIDDIGLRISRLPSKEYMLNLIWVLDNNNSIFDLVPQDLEDSSMIDFPIHLFNNVNTQIFPPGQGALFKRTKEQQERYLKSKYEVKIQQKQNRVDMLSKEKEKVVQRKQALERKLNISYNFNREKYATYSHFPKPKKAPSCRANFALQEFAFHSTCCVFKISSVQLLGKNITQINKASNNLSALIICQEFIPQQRAFSDPICAICQEQIFSLYERSSELISFLSCGHYYCYNCISYQTQLASQNSLKCPQCREQILFQINTLPFLKESINHQIVTEPNGDTKALKLTSQQAVQMVLQDPQSVCIQLVYNFQVVGIKRYQNIRQVFAGNLCFSNCGNQAELGCELSRKPSLMFCTQCIQGGSQHVYDAYQDNSLMTCGCSFLGKSFDIKVTQDELTAQTKELALSLSTVRDLRAFEVHKENERKQKFPFYCDFCHAGYATQELFNFHLIREHELYAYKIGLVEFLCFNCLTKVYKKHVYLTKHQKKCSVPNPALSQILKLLMIEK